MPNTGYHFVSWSDGGLTATRTDTNVHRQQERDRELRDQHVHADLHRRCRRNDLGASPQTVNYNASGTAVTAVPNTGYHFVSWSDGGLTATRTDTNVTANKSVTASFAANTTYTLTYTAGAGGTISGTSPQTVSSGGSGTAVTAVPSAGYHFVNWSDGGLTATRTDTNVTRQQERDRELRDQRHLHADLLGWRGWHDLGHEPADGLIRRQRHSGHCSAQWRLPLRELERR